MEQEQKESYGQFLLIKSTPSTAWEPEQAKQLLVHLFSIPQPFRLYVGSVKDKIGWWLEVPKHQVPTVKNLIYRFYPHVRILQQNRGADPIGAALYPFRTAEPFIRPLLAVEDCKKIDPLVSLVRAITTKSEGEDISLRLTCRPVIKEHYELGGKILSSYAGSSVDTAKMRIMETKLSGPLKHVEISLLLYADPLKREQELLDLLRPTLAVFDREWFNFLVHANEDAYDPILSPSEIAALWHLPNEQFRDIPNVAWTRSKGTPLPQMVASQTKGIILGENHFQGEAQEVRLSDKARSTHINVIGKTEMGKTTLMHNLIHQDIASRKGVGVIDPHGDLIDLILQSSIPPEREKDVCLVDVADVDFPVGLNILAAPEGVQPDVVAGQVLSIFKKQFEENWSDTRMETALYAALRSLTEFPEATIQDMPRLFYNPAFRAEVLTRVTDPNTLSYWYDQFDLGSEGLQRQIAEPILNRVSKFYRHESTRRLLAQQNSINIRQIIDEGKIFLAKLSGVPETEAETLGSLLISKFQIAAMSRIDQKPSERVPYYLYVDEVQKFITTSLPQVFSEARKYGLRLAVANQFLGQLTGKTLEAIIGNVGTTFVFRVGTKDAKALAPFMAPHFVAQSLEQMQQFQSAIKMNVAGSAQPAFSVSMKEPVPTPEDAMDRLERITALSRKQYARSRTEVDEELLKRFRADNSATDPANQVDDFYG